MTEILDRLIAELWSFEGFAISAGLVAAWSATQTAKKHWQFGGRRAIVTALVIGFCVTYLLFPGWGAIPIGIGLAVGLVAPGAYKILVAVIRRRWPDIAAEMSGDRK